MFNINSFYNIEAMKKLLREQAISDLENLSKSSSLENDGAVKWVKVTNNNGNVTVNSNIKKEKEMNLAINASDASSLENDTREYLKRRLREIENDQYTKLQKQYRISDDPAPKTPQEYVDRIKAGAFRFFPADGRKDGEEVYYSSPYRYFEWRTQDADSAGYAKAQTALKDMLKNTKDAIMVKAPAEALTALQALETATF